MRQSQSLSLLFISLLLCLATTTILSKTIKIFSNANEIVQVVRSKSPRRTYVMVEALTPHYQPSAVGASIRRTSTSSLSSSIELPFSSTTIGHQHHRRRPHKEKGNDAAVVQKTKTNAAVGVTTTTYVDPFLIHLSHHHNQHHRQSQKKSLSATTSSSSSSSTKSTTATAAATHFAYQRPRYGRSTSRRLQRRLHILKTALQELEVNRRNQN